MKERQRIILKLKWKKSEVLFHNSSNAKALNIEVAIKARKRQKERKETQWNGKVERAVTSTRGFKSAKSQYGSNALEKDSIWQHITKLQSQVSTWELNKSQ